MTALLQDWATAHAQRTPESTAIVCGAERLAYGELEALSNRLARALRERGCRRGDRVAVLMPKSPMAIAALLAIYKADAVYVPLDPSSPARRLGRILDSCENRWLLAAGAVRSLLEELSAADGRRSMDVGWLSNEPAAVPAAFTLADITACSPAPLDRTNHPEDAAHILFTSGSTGTPKGVVITHANVIAFVDWATGYFGMNRTDRVSGHPPLHFDLSFFDIFGAAAVGAELHLVPAEFALPNKLADFIRTSALTQWFSVPSVLTYMARFDVIRLDDFPALRRVLWCGEVLPTPALMHWMRRLPHVSFTNLYGPTEATIASSYYTVPECPASPQAAIPIGAPCADEELLVLDDAGRRTAPGGVGDLYIAGAGLAAGYWRDPERTAAAFVPHRERPSARMYKTGDLARVGDDGLVYFLGRRDTQIKSRGYRIELGEIEAALHAVAGVQECAVVAVPTDGFEGTAICCAYVAAAGTNLPPAVLRRELSRLVPPYMLPSRWLALERFPRNANGKTDRGALSEAFQAVAA